jgi:hypothetical protein
MEVVESNYKSNQSEKSTVISELTNRMLGAAFDALRRRKKEVYLELREPAVLADRERQRPLLMELDRIARALYWLSAVAGGAL